MQCKWQQLQKVKVALRDASEWSDDAFDQTPSLEEVENSIHTKSHLPNIPSAGELVENGYELKSMDAKLLAQIELEEIKKKIED